MKLFLSYKTLILTLLTLMFSGCGSSNNENGINQKAGIVSSSNVSATSSSTENSEDNLVEFIFPTQKSNLYGLNSTKVILREVKSSQNIKSINAGNLNFIKDGSVWVTPDSSQLSIPTGVLNQEILVTLELESGEIRTENLLVSSHASGQAGAGDLLSATGVGFNIIDASLYFTDPYKAQLQKFNYDNGEYSPIYTSNFENNSSDFLYWSMAVDSYNNEIYILTDNFYSNPSTGIDEYNTALLLVDSNSGDTEIFKDTNNRILSARGLVLDLNSEISSSGENQVVYFLDHKTTKKSLGRWYITNSDGYAGQPYEVSVGGEPFTEEYGPKSLAIVNKELYILREYSDDSLTGASSLLRVVTEETPDGIVSDTVVVTNLISNGYEIRKPTALLAHTNNDMFIAGQDRIWKFDLANQLISLISSSNLAEGELGKGPRLGSSISAMAMHPEYNILYLAAGAQGVIAIDIETGDRITVAK